MAAAVSCDQMEHEDAEMAKRLNGMSVAELLATRKWKPIPHCPGRYVLVTQEPFLAPEQLAQVESVPLEFRVKAASDLVLVLPLDGGGIITYRRSDGSHLHTLNTEAGFNRKLAQLGISLSDVLLCAPARELR